MKSKPAFVVEDRKLFHPSCNKLKLLSVSKDLPLLAISAYLASPLFCDGMIFKLVFMNLYLL